MTIIGLSDIQKESSNKISLLKMLTFSLKAKNSGSNDKKKRAEKGEEERT